MDTSEASDPTYPGVVIIPDFVGDTRQVTNFDPVAERLGRIEERLGELSAGYTALLRRLRLFDADLDTAEGHQNDLMERVSSIDEAIADALVRDGRLLEDMTKLQARIGELERALGEVQKRNIWRGSPASPTDP